MPVIMLCFRVQKMVSGHIQITIDGSVFVLKEARIRNNGINSQRLVRSREQHNYVHEQQQETMKRFNAYCQAFRNRAQDCSTYVYHNINSKRTSRCGKIFKSRMPLLLMLLHLVMIGGKLPLPLE